jgi:voltage-gated sodium channel
MEVYPLAWVFFVPFVIITSFAVLNLFIALIVNSMQMIHMQDRESAESAEITAHTEREQLLHEVRALRAEIRQLGAKPQ